MLSLKQVPAPVEPAMEHLLDLLVAAVPDAAARKVPVLAGTDLSGLQPPLQPTPALVQTGKVPSVGDDEVYICLGGENAQFVERSARLSEVYRSKL